MGNMESFVVYSVGVEKICILTALIIKLDEL